MAHLSLEPFLNRKRLFVRVQASISRELFVQKLNSAFPGARIGVGNINAERGPVTQRVADINFDTASEAQQALRRNRFKLRVGNHDADITYQIERKDVVEKLAGEWGCRFMVVVKNLPSGEVSCAELCELFEAAGEIFTIKVLPGNRGEPYALVQYVEEHSVEVSIQSINNQKLHGAVLCVERHLKARRQTNNNQTVAQPKGAEVPAAPTVTSPTNQSAQQHNNQPTPAPAAAARAPTAAAAVAGTGAQAAAPPRTAAAAVAAPSQPTQPQPAQQPAAAPQTFAQASQAQQQPAQPARPAAPLQTQASPLSPTGSIGGASQAASTPFAPAAQAPAKPALDTSTNSLFSNHYMMTRQDSNQYANGGTPSALADRGGSIFSNADLGLTSASSLGTSPSALLGGAAALGSMQPLRSNPSNGGVPGLGLLGQSAGLGSLATANNNTVTQQVLTPMLDLFSHLREPITGGSPGSALQGTSHEDLANGVGAANGNGLHGSGIGGYASMLLRTSSNAPAAPAGILSPTSAAAANGGGGALGFGAHGAGGAGGLGQQQQQQHGVIGSVPGSARAAPPGMGSLMTSLPQSGQQGNPSLTSPVSQSASQQQQFAAAAILGSGQPRISIRDSLRLALGRLEEMVTCPITGEIMKDPVVAADGHSYERSAIQTWMAAHNVSPISGEMLQHKMLTSNRLAKDIIADILPQP